MNEPTPQGPNPQPKMSRDEAEAMIKAMEQELVMQRAKRAATESSESGSSTKWLMLLFALFLLLGILVAGFWYTNSQLAGAKPTPGQKSPTTTPKK